MRFVCITDIHGYLDQALYTIEGLEDELGENLINGKQWISEDKLILNGDMFDRGPQNREALEWAFENADVYNIGNHEFFAMFPDVVNDFMSESYFESHGDEGLYWRDMSEEMRHRLLEKVADGEITAAFEGPNHIYSHSGSEDRPDVEDLNMQLREAGRKLLEAHEKLMDGDEQAFIEAQRDLVDVVETEKGNELKSEYPDLFDVVRDDRGFTATGGIVWNRFYEMESEVPQVVGHTMGSYMVKEGHDWNPQRRGEILNINTIRDSMRGDSDIALTVEGDEGLEVYTVAAPE